MLRKQKFYYMIAGAIIASCIYFLGVFSNLDARNDVTRVKTLVVTDVIFVGKPEQRNKTIMTILPNGLIINDETEQPVVSLVKTEERKAVLSLGLPHKNQILLNAGSNTYNMTVWENNKTIRNVLMSEQLPVPPIPE